MSKKHIVGIIMAGLFFVPSFSVAQSPTIEELTQQINELIALVATLQTQITSQSSDTSPVVNTKTITSCLTISNNLAYGSRDLNNNGEVTKLQRFLKDNISYPSDSITGFFGPTTERYVKNWQASNGIVSSGTPDTTGYGAVGPKTRRAMKAKCGLSAPVVISTTSVPAPVVVAPPSVPPVTPPIVVPLPTTPPVVTPIIIPIPPVVSTTRPPSITVTSPIAGELLEIGKTYQIKWDSVNIPKTSNVSIELLKLTRITRIPNRTNKESNLRVYNYSRYGASYIGNVLNDGIESWTVPSNIEVGGQYIIYISGCSTIVDERFEGGYVCVNTLETSPMLSVVGSSTATPISVIQPIVVPIPSTSVVTPIVIPLPPSITVTSPKKGQIWYPGNTYRVKWDSTLIDNKSVEIYISDSSISGSGSTNYITPNGVQVSNIGYYDWLVPPLNQLPGGGSSNYTIRVVDSSTNISGISNSFGIADTNIMLDLTILIVRAGLFADIGDYVSLNGILKEVKTSINKLSPFVGRTSGEASALLGLIDNLNEQVLTLSLNINAENKTKIRGFIDQMGTLAQRLSPLLVSDSVAFKQYKQQQIADVSSALSGVTSRLYDMLRRLDK